MASIYTDRDSIDQPSICINTLLASIHRQHNRNVNYLLHWYQCENARATNFSKVHFNVK